MAQEKAKAWKMTEVSLVAYVVQYLDDGQETAFHSRDEALRAAAAYVGNHSGKHLEDEISLYGPGDGSTSCVVRKIDAHPETGLPGIQCGDVWAPWGECRYGVLTKTAQYTVIADGVLEASEAADAEQEEE